MRLVVQRGNTDCGIATIAMLTDRSYTDVIRTAVRLFDYPATGPFSTTFSDMRGILDHYGLNPGRTRRFRGFDRIDNCAAVLINYSRPSSIGHWVAFERGPRRNRVLNPGWWLKHPIRNRLDAIRATHYIPIEM